MYAQTDAMEERVKELRAKVPDIDKFYSLKEAASGQPEAYKARLAADGYTGETYKEQLKKFYESFAYVWRVQYSDEKLGQFPEKDVHSHARLRTNGVVMNTDLWYELFGVDRN